MSLPALVAPALLCPRHPSAGAVASPCCAHARPDSCGPQRPTGWTCASACRDRSLQRPFCPVLFTHLSLAENLLESQALNPTRPPGDYGWAEGWGIVWAPLPSCTAENRGLASPRPAESIRTQTSEAQVGAGPLGPRRGPGRERSLRTSRSQMGQWSGRPCGVHSLVHGVGGREGQGRADGPGTWETLAKWLWTAQRF